MAQPTNAKSALPYLQRLLEDEFVQEQLRNAASGARAAYLRARKQRNQAADDKTLYRHLRQTATSIRNATIALQRPQRQPRRRTRKLATIALAIAGCAWLTIKLQRLQSQNTNPAAAPDSSYTTAADTPPIARGQEQADTQTAA